MKEFNVELGGATRRLRYSSPDARALFARFKKPLGELIYHELMGLDESLKLSNTGNPEVQFWFLFLGLKHDLPKLDEKKLDEWITGVLDSGESMGPIYGTAGRAALYSGIVTGKRLDFEEELARLLKEKREQLEGTGTPGNEPEPATEPEATPTS